MIHLTDNSGIIFVFLHLERGIILTWFRLLLSTKGLSDYSLIKRVILDLADLEMNIIVDMVGVRLSVLWVYTFEILAF